MKRCIFCLVTASFFCCNLSDETERLSGGWTYAKEGKNQKIIVKSKRVIPCEILDYDYNEEFIIAVQKPTKDCFIGTDSNVYRHGKDQIYFWIISNINDRILGPMNFKEFNEAKAKFHIGTDLILKSF